MNNYPDDIDNSRFDPNSPIYVGDECANGVCSVNWKPSKTVTKPVDTRTIAEQIKDAKALLVQLECQTEFPPNYHQIAGLTDEIARLEQAA